MPDVAFKALGMMHDIQSNDDKLAIFSPFEMHRKVKQIDAPAFMINL